MSIRSVALRAQRRPCPVAVEQLEDRVVPSGKGLAPSPPPAADTPPNDAVHVAPVTSPSGSNPDVTAPAADVSAQPDPTPIRAVGQSQPVNEAVATPVNVTPASTLGATPGVTAAAADAGAQKDPTPTRAVGRSQPVSETAAT